MSGGVFVITPGIQAAWQNLARQLQPSSGAGSGPQPGQTTGNKQWLRKFNLTVYAPVAASTTSAPTPATNAGPETSPPTRARWTPRVVPRDPDPIDPEPPSTAQTPPSPSNNQPPTGAQPGLDLSNLRCAFNLQGSVQMSPNFLKARIYNMAPATMQKVLQMGRVVISAGYVYGQFGVIFDGIVVQYVRGKESPVDTYLDIYAGDGDGASTATVFTVFPQGTSEQAKMQHFFQAEQANEPNLKWGQNDTGQMAQAVTLRDHVAAGNTTSYRRELALKWQQDQYYHNGTFNVLKKSSYADGEAVVLTPATGLVGLPEVTPQGIQARCLLNPKLKLGGLVKIQTAALSGVPYIPGSTLDQPGLTPGQSTGQLLGPAALPNQKFEAAPTSPTGTYKICWMNITGDTRGDPWYCDLTCVALDSNNQVLANPANAFFRPGRGTNTGIGALPPGPPTNAGGT